MNNWLTKHNVQVTRGISSASLGEILANNKLQKKYEDGTIDYIQFVPNKSVDVRGLSMYSMNSSTNYRLEYNCELYRRYHEQTKLYPSRMSCIYAFGDYESCEKVAQKYSWDLKSVQRYKIVEIPLTKIVKVNMEIISIMRTVGVIGTWTAEQQEMIWEHYWGGKGNIKVEVPANGQKQEKLSSGVIWEYLIEGRLELV